MPFSAPWLSYQAGDLVYGLETARTRYLTRRGEFRAEGDKAAYTRIDELAILAGEKAENAQIASDTDSLRDALKQHAKYHKAIGSEQDNWSVRAKSKGALYWATMVADKRVHFILDDLNLEAVPKKSAGGNNPDNDGDPISRAGKNRSITGAELRWIYRNRTVDRVIRNVQFWFSSQPCVPPWVTYKKPGNNLWDPYIEMDGVGLWSQ